MLEIGNGDDFAIRAESISKKFMLGRRSTSVKDRLTGISDRNREEFWAFEDVSVTVPRGSMLGVIGRNGSGKSTFLRALCGVYRPTKGQVLVRGRVTALLELGAGFHSELTGRENIYMNGAVVGLGRDYMDSVMSEIIEMADIGSFIDAPIEIYSSGMRARLGFAVSVQMQPEILLADEITAVGDIAFKDHGVRRMNELRENGATIVQVSHSLPMLAANCDQILWLHHGQMRGLGDPKEVIAEYEALGNVESSGRMIGGQAPRTPTDALAPPEEQSPKNVHPAEQQLAERAAEAGKKLAETDLHPEWFESVTVTGANDGPLETGEPAHLTMKIDPDSDIADPSLEVRVLNAIGRSTGIGFESWSLGSSDFDGEIRATLDSLYLSAGRYQLRFEIWSAGNLVASTHHLIRVDWPPRDTDSFSPMSVQWSSAAKIGSSPSSE